MYLCFMLVRRGVVIVFISVSSVISDWTSVHIYLVCMYALSDGPRNLRVERTRTWFTTVTFALPDTLTFRISQLGLGV